VAGWRRASVALNSAGINRHGVANERVVQAGWRRHAFQCLRSGGMALASLGNADTNGVSAPAGLSDFEWSVSFPWVEYCWEPV
jgi:hypothetical protein